MSTFVPVQSSVERLKTTPEFTIKQFDPDTDEKYVDAAQNLEAYLIHKDNRLMPVPPARSASTSDKSPLQEMSDVAKNGICLLLIETATDKLAGVAYGQPSEDYDKTFTLSFLVVRPEYQNFGLGKLLLAEYKRLVKQKKYKHLILAVVTNNTRAVGFYEHSGFKCFAQRMYLDL